MRYHFSFSLFIWKRTRQKEEERTPICWFLPTCLKYSGMVWCWSQKRNSMDATWVEQIQLPIASRGAYEQKAGIRSGVKELGLWFKGLNCYFWCRHPISEWCSIQSSSLLMHMGREWNMAQVLVPLSPTWETCTQFWVPRFGLNNPFGE